MSERGERRESLNEEAARDCERDTGEVLELLLGAVEALRRIERAHRARAEGVTWLEARQAAYLLGLAEGLSAALAPPADEPGPVSGPEERAVAHAIGRALEGTSFMRAPASVWEREVARHGGGEIGLPDLEEVLRQLARASTRREGPLWRMGIKLTRLADGSYRASRRSRQPNRTNRGDEGGVA